MRDSLSKKQTNGRGGRRARNKISKRHNDQTNKQNRAKRRPNGSGDGDGGIRKCKGDDTMPLEEYR